MKWIIDAALVGVGGFIGALARYGINGWIGPLSFPYGTLVVNLVGCFTIGMIAGLTSPPFIAPEFRAFAIVGLLGGFTTFSAFGYETFMMMHEAQYVRAAANLCGHILIGITLVGLGYAATHS